jgi:hypothetical protein
VRAEHVGQFAHERFAPFAETLLTSQHVSSRHLDFFLSHFAPHQDVQFYLAKAVATVAHKVASGDQQVLHRLATAALGSMCAWPLS